MGLSNDWTLTRVKAQVRAQTSLLSQQESGMIESQLNDLVHESVLSVRGALDILVDDEYRISANNPTVPGTFSTSSSGYCDNSGDPIASGTIYDMNLKNMSLFGVTQYSGEIPIFSKKKFDALRSVLRNNTTDFAVTKGIATVYSTTTGTVIIAVYGYPTANTAPTFNFIYLRQPTRETTDTNTIDLPDRWVPLLIDHCTAQIFKRLSKTVPPDIDARLKADVTNIAQMINTNFNPQTVR
jgi:hypothetical protein